MKKINIKQGISSILLAGTILVTGSSLTGCLNYPNKDSTFVNKNANSFNTKTKTFNEGEHIISKPIPDLANKKLRNPYNEVHQIEYHEGYKCIGLGVFVEESEYHKSYDEAKAVFINEYKVECELSGTDVFGNEVYSDFGKPVDFTKIEHDEVDDEKIFEIGTHILTVPVRAPKETNVQYTYHEGYELVDIALTGDSYYGSTSIAMYVNTEKVKCKKTNKSEFLDFGKPVEKNKTLIK